MNRSVSGSFYTQKKHCEKLSTWERVWKAVSANTALQISEEVEIVLLFVVDKLMLVVELKAACDFQQVVTCSGDGACQMWDVEHNEKMDSYRGHTQEVMGIDLAPLEAGNIFVSGVSAEVLQINCLLNKIMTTKTLV